MTEPPVIAAPAVTKPRRLSMRSIPVNSVRTAAIRSGAQGSPSGLSVLLTSRRFPARPRRTNPRSSMVTTRPSRSVNRAASTFGTGSRGSPPCRSSAAPARCRWPAAGGPWPPPAGSPAARVRLSTSRTVRRGRRGGCWVVLSRQAPRFSAELTVALRQGVATIRQGSPGCASCLATRSPRCQVGKRHPVPATALIPQGVGRRRDGGAYGVVGTRRDLSRPCTQHRPPCPPLPQSPYRAGRRRTVPGPRRGGARQAVGGGGDRTAQRQDRPVGLRRGPSSASAIGAVHRICPEFNPVQVMRRSGRSVLLIGTTGRTTAVAKCLLDHSPRGSSGSGTRSPRTARSSGTGRRCGRRADRGGPDNCVLVTWSACRGGRPR